MARRKYGRFTYKRKAALHKAQLASARKRKGMSTRKKLAIAGGVGVIVAGTAAVMYGNKVVKGGPRDVIKHTPPQAIPNKDARSDLPPWHIGDHVYPSVGDAVEVSLKNKILDKGYSRFYGTVTGMKWGRHTPNYRVNVRHSVHNGLLDDFVKDYQITGIKVGGAANLDASLAALREERKRHRY